MTDITTTPATPIDELKTAVERAGTVEDSVVALVEHLATEPDPAGLAVLVAQLNAESDKVAAAVVANTPVADHAAWSDVLGGLPAPIVSSGGPELTPQAGTPVPPGQPDPTPVADPAEPDTADPAEQTEPAETPEVPPAVDSAPPADPAAPPAA
jgi:hypothetical protein